MKIKSIECLKLVLPPLKNPTPPRPNQKTQPGNPRPIHKYPEFPRVRANTPGDVAGEMWVRVTAENGESGLGTCHWGNLTKPVIDHVYAPLITGRDCLAIEFLNDLMWRASLRFGATGLAANAMSAIDVALWDLKGKLLGVPVYSLLGGPCRPHLDYYVTATDLDWAMELGFKAFKITNTAHYEDGTEGINRLEELVATSRDTVGPDADLMLNPVMSYNVEYGARVMERLKPYNLRWIEEPLAPHDNAGLLELKKAVPTIPLATGEDHRLRHAFREMIELRCVDVIQPDIRWVGGLTETVKIYTLAEAAGIPTFSHVAGSFPAGQHFHFAFPEALQAEHLMFSPAGVPLEEVMRIPGMPVPKGGRVVPSDAPGLGMEITPEMLLPW